ncbi:phage integrase [Ketogulonicigenium robustum]|uniref:Phage integrase n=1 Tax=Ketogulonicigenium robustum TaxID=92947 RepID=A0A1W6NWN9_9RHOB|nr:site-specific integrase [Ketogulonicigenium robustum]ARO13520.1 phage integrase [Ketogulonicigenium robustum]
MADAIKITKRAVDALKAKGARYTVWDTELAGFGLRVGASGSKSYVLKYRVGGGRAARVRWGVIGQHGALTPDQAREIAQRWASDVAAGGDPAGDRLEKRKSPTVAELLAEYQASHVEAKNKGSTARNVALLINGLILPALGRLKVADVTTADVARFHSANAKTPYQANRARSVLAKAFGLAETWGYRERNSNPCADVEKYPEKARDRFLSPAEFAALGDVLARAEAGERLPFEKAGKVRMVAISQSAIAAVRLMIFTGARAYSEILSLRWEWIDWHAGRANLPDSKTGKKPLMLPPAALEVLRGLDMPQDGRGFVIRGGNYTDPETPLVNLKDPWNAIRMAAGLPDVRPHDLRHSFASVMVAGGASLPLIGALLGHSDVRTTARYAHLATDPLKAAADHVGGVLASHLKGPDGGAEIVPLHRKG